MMASGAEHAEYHYVHCCTTALRLSAVANGRVWSDEKVRGILSLMRSECPECLDLGWSGSETMD